MKLQILLVLSMAVLASYAETGDGVKDPSYYKCPFRIFDNGAPATNELGEVMYCDVDGVRCPNYYFCNSGHPDGRAICCHILGP